MFACQWSFDIPFDKQSEAFQIMKAWAEDSSAYAGFKRAISRRIMVGHKGVSASHIIVEHVFESLADFEEAISGMGAPQFKKHSDSLVPYMVSGSQNWRMYRVIE